MGEPQYLNYPSLPLAQSVFTLASPYASVPPSARGSTATGFQAPQQARYFHSRRIKKDEVQRPWLAKKDPKEKWVTIIPICGVLVGLIASGLLIWDGLKSVQKHVYCPVYASDFASGRCRDLGSASHRHPV